MKLTSNIVFGRNQDKVGWVSEDVMNLFKGENGTSIGNTPGASSHTCAIIGGVVGGTVAVVLAIVAFLLVRRHRSKKQWAAAQQQRPTGTPEYAAASSTAPADVDTNSNNYKYQPYASSSPGIYEAPAHEPGSNMVSAETSPMDMHNHHGQGMTTPQGPHQQPGPTGLPILHSNQQPGRQSHFYEMP